MMDVKTGGPIYDTIDILPRDKSFKDVVKVIQLEIDDTTNEYNEEIARAVFTAIRLYEREPFYFNESRLTTFMTRPRCAWYGADDASEIALAGGIREVFIHAQGQIRRLQQASAGTLECFSEVDHLGAPHNFALFNDQMRLYPTPDAIYVVRLYLSPARLDDITDSTTPSAWFSEAFDLIKAQAKYQFYKDILKDAEAATAARMDVDEQYRALIRETSRRKNVTLIEPTGF